MEQSRKLILTIVLSLIMAIPLSAALIPDDIPTIEALIDVHKRMKGAEDLAVIELTAIEETHSLTEKAAKAVNETRTVLNKRMSDANSYLSLALQLTNVTLKVKNLIENYADFTTLTYEYALKQPLVMVYYVNANAKIKKEVEHISTLFAGYSAAGLNILKATMEEKYRVLGQIQNAVARINMIISHANLVCKGMLNTGIRIYHIEDIINNKTNKSIADELIALWKGN